MAVCANSTGALIFNLPHGLAPLEAIANAAGSSSASNAPLRS
jgi:hypothetical protein